MKGLSVRIARGVNAAAKRRGRVIAHRYHVHVLKTPTETRNALRYVLLNRFVHKNRALAGRAEVRGFDALSSADYFDGWAPGTRAGPVFFTDDDASRTTMHLSRPRAPGCSRRVGNAWVG